MTHDRNLLTRPLADVLQPFRSRLDSLSLQRSPLRLPRSSFSKVMRPVYARSVSNATFQTSTEHDANPPRSAHYNNNRHHHQGGRHANFGGPVYEQAHHPGPEYMMYDSHVLPHPVTQPPPQPQGNRTLSSFLPFLGEGGAIVGFKNELVAAIFEFIGVSLKSPRLRLTLLLIPADDYSPHRRHQTFVSPVHLDLDRVAFAKGDLTTLPPLFLFSPFLVLPVHGLRGDYGRSSSSRWSSHQHQPTALQ